ncbi:DUF262 domain-containing protein [Salmonella enterica]|nr:DUF262 domain-containing protein [Salmonella enterica]
MSTFDTTKIALKDILGQITDGRVQLPDFQRGWVWDDEHVRSLLVSIARSFPVGAVMLLETGGEVRFQVRPVENVELQKTEPEMLILDGQQRLTSLTQVLMLDTPVKTFNEKGKQIDRFYYIDIEAALDNRLDEAFISVEKSKKVTMNFGRDIKTFTNSFGETVEMDFSTVQKECEALFSPCNQIINSDAWESHLYKCSQEKFFTYMQFREKILNAFRNYLLPVIKLGKSTSKEAVCLVFEKVNTGGVPLSVFELVTASFAADGFNLRDDWFGSNLRQKFGRRNVLNKEAILQGVEPTDFLQAISILNTLKKRRADLAEGKTGKSVTAVSAKRVSVLALSLEDYHCWADDVEKGFLLAAKFLHHECFMHSWDLPYRTQLVPLAAVLSQLQGNWLEPKIYDKLARWFWCGVLGELYGGAVETRIANDVEELLNWIEGEGEEPRTIYEASFQPGRLLTLRSRLSAAYKALSVLILRNGAQDFFWKSTIQKLDYGEIALDIHHIFPKIWCETNNISPAVYNSIINKTSISYKANRMIGGRSPAEYLSQIQTHPQVGLENAEMDAILRSHFIEPSLLRQDSFEAFFADRKKQLLKLIEAAMGKNISQDDVAELETATDEIDV